MEIRAENLKKIRDLEEEFSDERIAEIFQAPGESGAHVSGRQGRLTFRVALRRAIILAGVFVVIIILLQFFTPRIIYVEALEGAVQPKDCLVIAVHAYDFSKVKAGDLIAYEDKDGNACFGVVIESSGEVVVINNGDILVEQVSGKVLFRLLPVSRGGSISVSFIDIAGEKL